MSFKLIISGIYCLLGCSYCFNFFPKYAQVFTVNEVNSYFGYSVLLQSSSQGNSARLIVGSPQSNSSFPGLHIGIVEPGAVYSCPTNETQCQQFRFDSNGNTEYKGTNSLSYVNKKEYAKLGWAIDGEDIAGGLIVACAPKWINQLHKDHFYFLNGMCYLRKESVNIEKNAESLIPLVFSGKQGYENTQLKVHEYYYALGQAGFSVHVTQNNSEILIGAPGILQWKGMIVQYLDSNHAMGLNDHTNTKYKNYELPVPPNPFYVERLQKFGYFGYATSSGRFNKNSNKIWYVGGAPRGKNLLGQVLVYEYVPHKDELMIHSEMAGRQEGEYFGSAIAVGDINNDNMDDIIVGSPMYSTDKTEIGCAYVYTNNGQGIFQKKIIDGPQVPYGRFGSAVSVIGDINKDGFSDVAIGAPYFEEGRGAIFIYLGSKDGISNEFSQRIKAAEVNLNLRGFGCSISRGVDIDSNYYKDIAVGAYKSGHAVILKTRPVVSITPFLGSRSEKLLISTKSFKIFVCFEYDGLDVPTEIVIQYTIKADQFFNRIYFSKSHTNTLIENNTFRLNNKTCHDYDMTVSKSVSHYIQPIELQLTYGLSESHLRPDVFCATCPVIDQKSINTTIIQIPFEIGCGSDNICQPNLKLTAKFNHNKPDLVIGSQNKMDVSIKIVNMGEPAFLVKFSAEISKNTAFDTIPNVCQMTQNNLLLCDMGNPLMQNETKILTLELDLAMLNNNDELTLNLTTVSAGEETNEEDNAVILNLPLRTEVDVSVIGISDPEQFTFVDENKLLKQDSFTFEQQFMIHNLGPSALDDLEVNILIPYKYGSSQQILNVFEPDFSSTEDISLTCTTSDANGFFVNNKGFEGTDLASDSQIISDMRIKRSAEVENIQTNSAVYSKMQKILGSNEIIPEDLPLNRTLSLNCNPNRTDLTCMEIKCVSGPLRRIQSQVTIKIKMVANLKILDNLREEKDIIVLTTSILPISKHFAKSVTYTHTLLQGSLRPGSAVVWIILGIILGLIILLAIMYALYKFGFFKRTNHSELINEKDDKIEDKTMSELSELAEISD